MRHVRFIDVTGLRALLEFAHRLDWRGMESRAAHPPASCAAACGNMPHSAGARAGEGMPCGTSAGLRSR
ncbi:hypothetical protein ACFQL8_09160 [Streptomyces goshikiensis]|uniref:hypothetical protein n=1 Tax=Streptomyces goshikiensis TaxID=1942 RepID=UPI0033268E79